MNARKKVREIYKDKIAKLNNNYRQISAVDSKEEVNSTHCAENSSENMNGDVSPAKTCRRKLVKEKSSKIVVQWGSKITKERSRKIHVSVSRKNASNNCISDLGNDSSISEEVLSEIKSESVNYEEYYDFIHHLGNLRKSVSHSTSTVDTSTACNSNVHTTNGNCLPAKNNSVNHKSKKDNSISRKVCGSVRRKPKITVRLLTGLNTHTNDHISVKDEKIDFGDGPYVCCECLLRFPDPDSFLVHMKSHNMGKVYSCTECKKQFSAKSTLQSHMHKHTGKLAYECKVCGRRFVNAGALYKHKMIHDAREKYKCEICGLVVKYSTNLNHHMRIHTGEVRYQCELCNKQFIMRSGYSAHMRIHIGKKEYQCDICDKTFLDRSALISHSRIHTGEQPYRCDQCGRRFSNASNLNRHVRSRHSGLKPFECRQCGKRFTNAKSVQYHDKLHAEELQEKSDKVLRKKRRRSYVEMEEEIDEEIDIKTEASD